MRYRYGRRHYWGAALAGVIAAAGPAHGQGLTSSGLTFGEPSREIELNVASDVLYDSNVSRTNEAGVNARGLEREDFIFRPRVEGNISLPTGAFIFTLSGLVGYDIYANNGRLDRERIQLESTAGFGNSRCSALVSGGYSRAQNDLSDLSIIPGNEEASTVNVQTVKRIGASAQCGSAVGISPVATIEYRTSDNSAVQRRISNYDNLSYSGGLVYSNPAFGNLTAFYGVSKFEYPDRDLVGLLVGADEFTVKAAGFRLDRRLGARLQVHGQVTYVTVDVDGLQGSQYDGINWDVSATLRASTRLQLTAAVARQINAASGFTSDFATTESYSLSADYALTQRLQLSAGVSHRTRDFALTLVNVPNQLSEDEVNQVSARLNFQRSPRLRFGLFGSYEDRKADLAIYRYDRFTAGISASLQL